MRILAFWSGSDFSEFLLPAFINRPDLQVEIVSRHRDGTCSLNTAPAARLRDLRRRLNAGEFDLPVCGNVWTSRIPAHKKLFTQATNAFRNSTYRPEYLDTDLVPNLFAYLKRPVPLAVLDMRDSHFVLPWDLPLLKISTLYFKRELCGCPKRSLKPLMAWQRRSEIEPLLEKIRPMSYGIDPVRIPAMVPAMVDRDIDIFMTGSGNPVREKISRKCDMLAGKYRVVVAREKVSHKKCNDIPEDPSLSSARRAMDAKPGVSTMPQRMEPSPYKLSILSASQCHAT